jgi:hypothetical protein
MMLGLDICLPELHPWDDDGGARVEVVTDPNWIINGQPRVVRRVGWRPCMCCKRRHFSQDIAKIRLCESCRAIKTDKSCLGGINFAPPVSSRMPNGSRGK